MQYCPLDLCDVSKPLTLHPSPSRHIRQRRRWSRRARHLGATWKGTILPGDRGLLRRPLLRFVAPPRQQQEQNSTVRSTFAGPSRTSQTQAHDASL